MDYLKEMKNRIIKREGGVGEVKTASLGQVPRHHFKKMMARHLSKGRLFSEERKAKMRGIARSTETKAKMALAHTGKTHTAETKAKILLSHPNSQNVTVRDIETDKTESFDSVRALARALGLNDASISKYLKSKVARPFKGRYEIKVGTE